MAALTLMIIRHAEKPKEAWPGPGLSDQGSPDDESLVIRGWQRAGAWATLFGAGLGAPDYPIPDAIYAADPGAGPSRRPFETVSPLSGRLGVTTNRSFPVGGEQALVAELIGLSGTVLVCWEHKAIVAEIVPRLALSAGSPPQHWPKERFDAVLRFDRADGAGAFRFGMLLPRLLSGDPDTGF